MNSPKLLLLLSLMLTFSGCVSTNKYMANIDDVKKRQDVALADTDQDGVIDAIDQEPNTPPDVPVDTKGRTLDSDKDGVADYKDLEPHYTLRAGERVNEDGVVINPTAAATPEGGCVTEERVQEMIDEFRTKSEIAKSLVKLEIAKRLVELGVNENIIVGAIDLPIEKINEIKENSKEQ
jgi:hypothetical protein